MEQQTQTATVTLDGKPVTLEQLAEARKASNQKIVEEAPGVYKTKVVLMG